MNNITKFFFNKYRGFSLPEALVMVIIVGYALVPIMGTFDNSTKLAHRISHKNTLRILARTRLNKEIANGAYDQSAIDYNTQYHYVYYDDQIPPIKQSLATTTTLADLPTTISSKILYLYKIEVELKSQFNMASTGITNTSYLNNINGLKAIVVKAEICPDYVTATETISYFSLINTPGAEGNFIYVVDSINLGIKVVDPLSKTVIDTIQIPKFDSSKDYNKDEQNIVRPWNLAVHPAGKSLLYQSKLNIYAVNLDKESSNYGQYCPIATFTDKIADVKKDDGPKAREDRGIALRPDGRYLYVSDHHNKSIHVFELHGLDSHPIAWPITCTHIYETADLGHDKMTAFTPGNDGWLYIGLKDENKIIRMQMFPADITAPKIQNTGDLDKVMHKGDFHISEICTTVDGKYIYAADDKKDPVNILKFSSNALNCVGAVGIQLDDGCKSMTLSQDAKYLMVTDKKDATNSGGVAIMDLTAINIGPVSYDTDPPDAAHQKVYPFKDKAYQLCLSPNLVDFTWTSEKNYLHFANIASAAAGSLSGGLPAQDTIRVTTVDKSSSDIKKRDVQHCLVGCSDGTIRYADIYAGILDSKFTKDSLPNNPHAIAIGPYSDYFICSYGTTDGGNHSHPATANSNTTLDLFDTWKKTSRKDLSTYSSFGVAILATETYTIDFLNGEIDASTPVANGYITSLTRPSNLPQSLCTNVDLSDDWIFQNVISLNKGGFLVLFKNDGTGTMAAGETLLDWIGEHKWNSDPRKAGDGTDTWPAYKGKFERFARWVTSTSNNFPPKFASKMAISIDDSLLAFTTGESGNQKVSIYDFNSQNFGALTQMEGCISQYYGDGAPARSSDLQTSISPSKTFFDLSQIKLVDAFTTNEPFTSMRTEPFRFQWSNTPGGRACVRVFGYFKPSVTVQKWASSNLDGVRMFLKDENTFNEYDFAWEVFSVNDLAGNYSKLVNKHTTCLIQTEHGYDNAVDGQCLMYSVNAGETFTTAAPWATDYNPAPSGWNHISAQETTPFLFRPQLVFEKQVATDPTTYKLPLTFNRDRSDPILYVLEGSSDTIKAIKIGKGMHSIQLPSMDVLNSDLAVSPDGQRLIVGDEGAGKLFIVNISSPYINAAGASYDFGSDVNPTASPYPNTIGTITAEIDLGANPTCLATLPFRSYASKTDKYETLSTTLPSNLSGCNLATIASGGIYILGGSGIETGTPRDVIWKFNPVNGSIDPLGATLNKAVNRHAVVSYNNDIYAIGGHDSSSSSDWVQRYCIASNSAESSYDAIMVAAPPIRVSSNNMTDYDLMDGNPGPVEIAVLDSSDENSTGRAWEVFKGVTPSYNDRYWTGSAFGGGFPHSLRYDFGSNDYKCIVNKIWVNPLGAGNDDNDVDKFELYGSDDGVNWGTILYEGSLAAKAAQSFPFNNSTPYRYYKYKGTSTFDNGSNYCTTGAIEFYLEGLRKITPITISSPNDGDASSPPSNAINGNLANAWDSNGNVPTNIDVDLGSSDQVNILRIYCKFNDDGLGQFFLQGSDVSNFSTKTDLFTTTHPNVTGWITYHITNPGNYRYYRLQCQTTNGGEHNNEVEIYGIEYYSTNPKPPTEDVLTKIMNDNRTTVPFEEGAACMTPYGIFMGGGHINNVSPYNSTYIYWPQGIDNHSVANSGFKSCGISRKLPNMLSTAIGFTFVWHKGCVYRIGGSSDHTYTSNMLTSQTRFNFEANAWETPSNPGVLFQRYKASACSLGDEIFIFGGLNSSGTLLHTAAAWNPETNSVRSLAAAIPGSKHYGMTAIPFGGSIYLIGGADSASDPFSAGSSTGCTKIIKYTP